MPHVLVNLAFAKGCLRKRPFESKEAAESLNPEDFRVYLCPFCKKWHRASKPHVKQRLLLRAQRAKQIATERARRKRELIRNYD